MQAQELKQKQKQVLMLEQEELAQKLANFKNGLDEMVGVSAQKKEQLNDEIRVLSETFVRLDGFGS